ncbi:bifunctional folylpolyglutamate synthase/dihydrofolate synthase [Blautia sp.]
MDYQECRAYIDDSAKYGSVLGLDNMREMLARLGNPQDALPYVHVAGTNGKGSVIAYLYRTLTEAGYKVGRYISPTLYSYRERLEIAGEKISREKFAKHVTTISQAIARMTEAGLNHPTPFEIETAAAFLYFKEENCDLVLLETGMGGNLDATNIVKTTKLAILVSISMDHMSFLGNTLGEIAEKKAGIIKSGCHVVTTKQQPDAARVIKDTCSRLEVPCVVSDPDEAVLEAESVFGQRFSYKGEEFEISLAGVYQKENAVLALNALEELDQLGWHTTMEQRKDGLLHTSWKGRFTVICKKPLFIVDGAHNAGAADKMAESIRHYFKGKKLIYIMGVFADKEYNLVLEKTAHFAEKIYTIETPDNPRALPAEELAKAARVYNSSAESTKSIKEAVEKVFHYADGDKDSVILAFGSLSFIGELTRAVEETCKK